MTKIRERKDIEPAVDEFYDLFTRPVTTASKFYTYYYLSEVRDLEGAGFKLMQFGRELSDAFLNYSLYACLREYTNYGLHFFIDNLKAKTISRANRNVNLSSDDSDSISRRAGFWNKRSNEQYVQWIVDNIGGTVNLRMDNPSAKTIADQMMTNWRLKFRPPAHREDIQDFMLQADRMYGYSNKIEEVFDALEFIFGYEWTSEDYMKHDDGWSVNYGGEAWARIAETAWEQRQELSDNAYIDLMWSVEHNNGNFIDKVDPYPEEDFRRFMDSSLADDFRQSDVTHLMRDVRMRELVQEVLQAAREENIRPLFQIALQDDRDLSRFRGEFM